MLESVFGRLLTIALIAAAAHATTILVRVASGRLLRSALHSETKAATITGFVTSTLVFVIYFTAVGFVLKEVGISLTTYVASASVIGLAVSFGSQGVVQDVINGLTVVLSDLVDVGDMVDIAGQTGIVQSVGMRFTTLVNFAGARVIVPNRSIGSVISYPKGYVRAYVDVRLPKTLNDAEEAARRVRALADAAYEQHPGILLRKPSLEGRIETGDGARTLRVKFRIWPGQGQVLENAVKSAIVQSMTELDAGYAGWMVTVHYRAEPLDGDPQRRLPRPNALRGARPRGSDVRPAGDPPAG